MYGGGKTDDREEVSILERDREGGEREYERER